MFPDPRSILITGASSGIGEALARHYAAPGITLHLGGRNPERLEAVARGCREAGAEVLTWTGEVTDAEGMRQWISQSDAHHPLNLVIANAGVALGSSRVGGLHRPRRLQRLPLHHRRLHPRPRQPARELRHPEVVGQTLVVDGGACAI